MSDALKPPEGWTLYHSIGLLLVGVSCIDGTLEPDEVEAIRRRLAQYPEVGDDTKQVLSVVVPYYERVRKAGDALRAFDKHCQRLARALPEDARKVVLDDLIAVVGSDDALHPDELSYLEAVYRHFGIQRPS
jgi:uncharacterized tellurite resistance protein B-like protein